MNIIKGNNVKILETFVNSSLSIFISPPRVCVEVFVKIGKYDKSGYYEPVRCVFSPDKNMWHCVIPPIFFPIGCITQYKVVARDTNGYRMNIGQNILRVIADNMFDTNENININKIRDCHIQLGDKWYAVRVADDGYSLVFEVTQETDKLDAAYQPETGSSPIHLDYKTPYAFNKNSNTYHKVTAFVDDSGTISAKVDEEGLKTGEKSFCYDSLTGFWYEMDSVLVDGEQCLEVGEKR